MKLVASKYGALGFSHIVLRNRWSIPSVGQLGYCQMFGKLFEMLQPIRHDWKNDDFILENGALENPPLELQKVPGHNLTIESYFAASPTQ